MIDTQKLLQWIECEISTYSSPYEDIDTPEDIAKYKARVNTLRILEMHITSGSLDVKEDAHERSEAPSKPPTR